MYVLFGDFIGYGLLVVIGVMLLVEVFYGMIVKGYLMVDIFCEMNVKLKCILLVGVFCCVILFNLSFQCELVEVWNGGLLDGYLLCVVSGEWVVLVFCYLLLGIFELVVFSDCCEIYLLDIEDWIFLFFDGVFEVSNKVGEMFGEVWLFQLFECNCQLFVLFDEIQCSLVQFCGVVQDDVSMFEVWLQLDSGL